MDGAGMMRIYRSILLPISIPAFVVVIIWQFTSAWNDFLWPRLVISSEARFTLPLGLAQLQMKNASNWGQIMAGATLTALPLILVFLLMQRQFISGMTEGAVKR